MPRPRKKVQARREENLASEPQWLVVEMSKGVLEGALMTVLTDGLEPIQREIQALNGRIGELEREQQLLTESLNRLPPSLAGRLNHFLVQLQGMLNEQRSPGAKESLQEQLQGLITALGSWQGQLKTEISSQRQLIESMRRLEGRLGSVGMEEEKL